MTLPEISRRRALATVAWATPAVVATSTAPAYAASTSTRSRYQIDWATSGYVPAASPSTPVAVVAARVSGTAGPATVIVMVSADEIRMGGPQRWFPAGGEDMTLAPGAVVNGRQGLVMSSTTSRNSGYGRTRESLSRTLVLTPVSFTMRALTVEVGPMVGACTGHGTTDSWLEPGYVDPMTGSHSRMDALRFACGEDIYTQHLDMVERAGQLEVEPSATTIKDFVARTSVTSAVFDSVDRESKIVNLWGRGSVHISHYNRCGGKLEYVTGANGATTSEFPWSPWVPITTTFGAISFDVEYGA